VAYGSISGRARTNPNSPRAHAICDRCGFRLNFEDLTWQFDWRGPALQNLRILVCNRCRDVPDEQLRAIVLPSDPMPIKNARVEPFAADEGANFPSPTGSVNAIGVPTYTYGNTIRSGPNTITYQPIGNPTGETQNAQMPLVAGLAWSVTVPVLSLIANNTTTVTATCSKAHGLSTGAQVSVESVTNKLASGIFTITVTTATAFTYTVYSAIPSGSLITGGTLVKTANIGLPLGYTSVPVISPT
jgi:hypothetical protein